MDGLGNKNPCRPCQPRQPCEVHTLLVLAQFPLHVFLTISETLNLQDGKGVVDPISIVRTYIPCSIRITTGDRRKNSSLKELDPNFSKNSWDLLWLYWQILWLRPGVMVIAWSISEGKPSNLCLPFIYSSPNSQCMTWCTNAYNWSRLQAPASFAPPGCVWNQLVVTL